MKAKKAILSLMVIMGMALVLTGCSAIFDRIMDSSPSEVVDGIIEEIMTGNYVAGTIDGNNFESEWLGLRFAAPSGFIMASQEEMNDMMQLGLDMLDMDRNLIAWADIAVVFEMMAMVPTGMASAHVATERIMLSGITIEQYVEAAIGQLESTTGWQVHFNDDIRPINFAGQQWYTYTADIHALGMDWSYQYLVRRFDNRMALITIYSAAGHEDYIDALFNAFRAY